MKTIEAEKSSLNACLAASKTDRIVIVRRGKPVALLIGVQDLDAEQMELGTSAKFWRLISERRRQRPIARAALERRLNAKTSESPKSSHAKARK